MNAQMDINWLKQHLSEDVTFQGRPDLASEPQSWIRYKLGILEEQQERQWSWGKMNEMQSPGKPGQKAEQAPDPNSHRSHRNFLFISGHN